MSDTLKILISEVINLKVGNKEFLLGYDPVETGLSWTAEIGNPSQHVRLGESDGEIRGASNLTPEGAVMNLLDKMKQEGAE